MSTITEIQDTLQNLTNTKITQSDIAEALGTGRSNISLRIKNNSQLSFEEVKKIESYFNVSLNEQKINFDNKQISNDIIKIPYFDWLPEELKNPKYPDVVARLHSIDDWGNADNLRIVAMNGDKMEHFWYRIRNKDVLLIDTKETKINNNGSGVYFATSRNNTKFWVREMTETIDDGIEFKAYAPSGVTVKLLSKQQLADADFRIIGRVIKNVSLTI